MKRFCFLAALMVLGPSAYAGNSISFSVGGHRIHIESSRHCRSTSCASVSVSGIGRKRDRYDDDRVAAEPVNTPPPAAPMVAPPPPPAITAAPIQPAAAPPPPAPPVETPAEAVRPAPVTVPQISKVSHEVEDNPADAPIGDWQTESKGTVRIGRCGKALCGYVLNSSANDKGEAVLINMKPKTDTRWTGNVYSHDSGDTYYGTMELKGANTLRVAACALGRFYCSGNNWSRLVGNAENLMTSRQVLAEPRS